MTAKMKVPVFPEPARAVPSDLHPDKSGTSPRPGISPVRKMRGTIKLKSQDQIRHIVFDPSLEIQ
jgi:hypothetical protein